MSKIKDVIASIRKSVDEQVEPFPVKVLGLVIGTATSYAYLDDEDEYYVLYYGFYPFGGSLPQGNILVDYEEGFAYRFKEDVDGNIETEWNFQFSLINHIVAMGV